MSWASDTNLRFQFFALCMAFLCPIGLIWSASKTRRQIASNSWPSARGVVEGTIAKAWVNEETNETKYYGRVVYRYAVDGKEYSSDLTDLGPGTKRFNQFEALADVGEYEPGMKVTVYYDPDDARIGIIEKGIPTIHLLLLGLLCLGTVICPVVSFFTVRSWLRVATQRRQDNDEPESVGP